MRLGLARGRARIVVIACAVTAIAGASVAFVRTHARTHGPVAQREALAAAKLEVQVSGCAAIRHGPVCEVAPGTEIRLWLPGVKDGAIHVASGGAEVPVTFEAWPDGRTVRLAVPEHATSLDVHVGAAGHEASAHVLLAAPPPLPPALQKERALRKEGHLDEAAAVLSAVSPSALTGDARATVYSDRARLEYQRGQIDAAIADYRQGIALHAAEGQPSEAALDASALTYLFHERDRIAEARAALAQETELVGEYPDGQADILHNGGLIAWDTGDLRTAVRDAREAEARFARLGNERVRRMTAVALGQRLLDLGRYAEAIAIFRGLLEAPDADACERADRLVDIGWAVLRSVEVDPTRDLGVDARDPLVQARDLLKASCPDPNRLANALVDLAYAELQHGRLPRARAALEETKKAERDARIDVILLWHHLAGRIALAEGAPERARAAFEREAKIAAALGSDDDRLSAAEGEASALEALGLQTQALAVLDEADELVDQLSASIPFGEGMDGFFATRDRAAMRRIDLLVQLGRPGQAMTAARRWRARVLDALRVSATIAHLDPEARGRWQDAIGRYLAMRDAVDADSANDWELSADRLAAARARRQESARRARTLLDDALSVLPRGREDARQPPSLGADELELLYVPAASGWLGFARTGDGLAVQRIDGVDPHASAEALSRALLGPFDSAIARARTIRLLPYGSVRGLDLHALPWRGRPLLEHAVVEYALGLDERAPAPPQAHHALVVADPSGDLPDARAEADAVVKALARSDWKVDDLRGDSADGEAVRRVLASSETDLLHYAGHASFGGADGADSALSLARGSRLTPADILALSRVPDVVALFGCDTAHESTTGTLDALGLTSAFLVDGAQVVIATSRVVADALARDVAAEFYARIAVGPDAETAGALRDAVLAVRQRSPASDWAAFRVLVP